MNLDWLKTIAPALATALGSPVAGLAVSFIADKLGVQDKTVKAVTDALDGQKMTPDQLTQIKLAEIEFNKFLQDKGIKLEEMAANDRDSARRREESVKDRTPAVLAGFITAGFFGVLAYLLVYGKPADGGDALMVMLGSLGTAWISVVAYYFGSSSGSAVKTDALARLASK